MGQEPWLNPRLPPDAAAPLHYQGCTRASLQAFLAPLTGAPSHPRLLSEGPGFQGAKDKRTGSCLGEQEVLREGGVAPGEASSPLQWAWTGREDPEGRAGAPDPSAAQVTQGACWVLVHSREGWWQGKAKGSPALPSEGSCQDWWTDSRLSHRAWVLGLQESRAGYSPEAQIHQ